MQVTCATTGGPAGGPSRMASLNSRSMAGSGCQAPCPASRLIGSPALATRVRGSARPIGSAGRPSSAIQVRPARPGSCRARRNWPSAVAARARAAPVRSASTSSVPGISLAPQNGQGYSAAGVPTSSGTGTGSGSSGASLGRAAISRCRPGSTTCRRGNLKTHCPSARKTVLSHPVASSSTGVPRRPGNCPPISAAASGAETGSSASQAALLARAGWPSTVRDHTTGLRWLARG
jgi:hypothetical protein